MPTNKEIGLRIKRLRESKKLSQEDLSKSLNVSNSTISMYERGERVPRDENKIKIASFFEVTVSSIFFDDTLTKCECDN